MLFLYLLAIDRDLQVFQSDINPCSCFSFTHLYNSYSSYRRKSGNKYAHLDSSAVENASTSIESSNGCPSDTYLDGAAMERKNGSKKRRRKKTNNHLVEVWYWSC